MRSDGGRRRSASGPPEASTSKSPREPVRVDCVDPSVPFSVRTLLQRLTVRGIRLVLEGNGIVAEGDLDRLADDDVALIKAHKVQVMAWLRADAMTEIALDVFGGRVVSLIPSGLRCACGGHAWRPSRKARGRVYCLACHRRGAE